MKKQLLVSFDTQLGPWAGYLNAYTTLIRERGSSPVSVNTQVQLLTRFCQWLRKRNTETYVVDEIIVERFLRRPQSAGSTRGGAAALCRFLRMLRDQGATRRPKKPPLSPQQRLTTSSGLKIGKAWRFRPSTIDEWLREQERRTAVE